MNLNRLSWVGDSFLGWIVWTRASSSSFARSNTFGALTASKGVFSSISFRLPWVSSWCWGDFSEWRIASISSFALSNKLGAFTSSASKQINDRFLHIHVWYKHKQAHNIYFWISVLYYNKKINNRSKLEWKDLRNRERFDLFYYTNIGNSRLLNINRTCMLRL